MTTWNLEITSILIQLIEKRENLINVICDAILLIKLISDSVIL
jgi:hypothetical protein